MVLSDFVAIGCIYFDFCCYLKVSALVLIFSMLSLDLDPGVITLFFLIYHKLLNCSNRVYIVSRVVFWYETFWWVLNLYLSFRTSYFFVCCRWLCTYVKYTIWEVYTLPSCFHPICIDTYEFFYFITRSVSISHKIYLSNRPLRLYYRSSLLVLYFMRTRSVNTQCSYYWFPLGDSLNQMRMITSWSFLFMICVWGCAGTFITKIVF